MPTNKSKYTDEFHRVWNGLFPFTTEAISENVPPMVNGVYQILCESAAGKFAMVYIGVATKTNNLRKRLHEHARGGGNKYLARIVDRSRYRFMYYLCDNQSALQIESFIRTHHEPPFNVRPELENLLLNITVH